MVPHTHLYAKSVETSTLFAREDQTRFVESQNAHEPEIDRTSRDRLKS